MDQATLDSARTVLHRYLPPDDVDDALQDACVFILEREDEFDEITSALLVRIARYKQKNSSRKHKLELSNSADSDGLIDPEFFHDLNSEMVDRLLLLLPQREREAVTTRYLDPNRPDRLSRRDQAASYKGLTRLRDLNFQGLIDVVAPTLAC